MFRGINKAAFGTIAALGMASVGHAEPSFHLGVGFSFSEVESVNNSHSSDGSFSGL